MSESTCGFKSRQPHHLASLEKMPLYARVVELADSLDSGSSVHYGRAGSSPASRTSSSQATYRLRRAFSFHCKAHRALILLLLASKPQPLCWVAVWIRRFAAVSSAKSALRPRSFLPLAEKNVIRPLPCSSFPTATRCAGLAVGRPPCGRHFLCPRSWEK